MPPPPTFDYAVFGLHVRSDLDLPELLAAPPGGQPQVTIRLGDVPAGVNRTAALQATEQGAVLIIDGIARYAIADGASIIVDREPDVPDANIRLYLLGSAMGVLLHQRGLLPLHANAVEIDGKAFAFMGASGSGKSTLAAWFHDHGYRIIADDVCAVRFDLEGRPIVTPGLPRLRLWKEALEGTGRKPSQFSRSYAGDETWDKYDVPLPHDRAVRTGTELAGVYLLGSGDDFAIHPLRDLKAAEAVFENTYRGAYLESAGNAQSHWESCLRLVRRVAIFKLSRPWGLARVPRDMAEIVANARKLGFAKSAEQPDQDAG